MNKSLWIFAAVAVFLFLVMPFAMATAAEDEPLEMSEAPATIGISLSETAISNVPTFVVERAVCDSTPPTDEAEETEEAETTTLIYYDVPLSTDLQEHIYTQLAGFGLPDNEIITILAVIRVESRYKASAVNYDGSCVGLMQVHKIHSEDLAEIGVHDLTDPYQNITAGISIYAECWAWAKDYSDDNRMAYALLAYNNGKTGAKRIIEQGKTVFTDYVNKVIKFRSELEVAE